MIYAHYNTFYTEQKRTENYEKKKKRKRKKQQQLFSQFPSFEQSVSIFWTVSFHVYH